MISMCPDPVPVVKTVYVFLHSMTWPTGYYLACREKDKVDNSKDEQGDNHANNRHLKPWNPEVIERHEEGNVEGKPKDKTKELCRVV
jgi:hypothetical protein